MGDRQCVDPNEANDGFFFSDAVSENVFETLQQNSYWAHPSNALVGMVANNDPEVRKEGIRLIGVARTNLLNKRQLQEFKNSQPEKPKRGRKRKTPIEPVVRPFVKPTLNNEFQLNFKAIFGT